MEGSADQETKSALRKIADFVAAAEIAPNHAARTWARDALIDCFGCILVGARQAIAEKTRLAFADETGPARVYGVSQRLSPGRAALINAVAGHALDLDDWEIPGNTHASVVLIPALLAAAESRLSAAPLTGPRLIEAYAAGFEVIARLGEAMNFDHYARGWHATATLGAIGAAAAVARLLAFDPEITANALSIAVSRAAGTTAQIGSDAKPLQTGFAAESSVIACQLAAAGLTGQSAALDAARGFAILTSKAAKADLGRALAKLGKPLALEEYGLVFKIYACCGYSARLVDCARDLRARGLKPEDVERITLELPDFHAAILLTGQPVTINEALFSLPFSVAMMLSQGDLTLQDLEAARWRDPVVRDLIARCTVQPFAPLDPGLNYDPRQPDRMTATLKSGETMTADVAYPLGAPQNPAPLDAILNKFQRNTGLGESAAEALAHWPESKDLLGLLNDLDPGA